MEFSQQGNGIGGIRFKKQEKGIASVNSHSKRAFQPRVKYSYCYFVKIAYVC